MVLAHRGLKIATLLGFTAICAAIFLYLFQDAGGRLSLSKPYTLSAVMPTTFNLVPNSDVRVAGVQVGTVKSVLPDGQNAKVTFQITKKTGAFPPIRADATDQVRTKTLVGESYLQITPGTHAAAKLSSGATLPLSRNVEAVPLEQVLNMFTKATRSGIEANMAGLGNGLNGHGAQLNTLFDQTNPAVDNANQLETVLNPERQQVAALIDDTGRVMQSLGQRTSQYQQLVADAKLTAQAVASRSRDLKSTLTTLPATLSVATTAVRKLNRFSISATPVFSQLRRAATKLTPAVQQLEPTAAASRRLIKRLQPFLNQLQPLMSQLKPGAHSLQSLVVPLDAVLRQANPALSYLAPYAKDLGAFFANVSGLANSYDKLGARGRVFPIVGPQEFDDLPPGLEDLVSKLEQDGTLGTLGGSKLNPYPQPGTAGDPGSSSAWKSVPAAN